LTCPKWDGTVAYVSSSPVFSLILLVVSLAPPSQLRWLIGLTVPVSVQVTDLRRPMPGHAHDLGVAVPPAAVLRPQVAVLVRRPLTHVAPDADPAERRPLEHAARVAHPPRRAHHAPRLSHARPARWVKPRPGRCTGEQR